MSFYSRNPNRCEAILTTEIIFLRYSCVCVCLPSVSLLYHYSVGRRSVLSLESSVEPEPEDSEVLTLFWLKTTNSVRQTPGNNDVTNDWECESKCPFLWPRTSSLHWKNWFPVVPSVSWFWSGVQKTEGKVWSSPFFDDFNSYSCPLLLSTVTDPPLITGFPILSLTLLT